MAQVSALSIHAIICQGVPVLVMHVAVYLMARVCESGLEIENEFND